MALSFMTLARTHKYFQLMESVGGEWKGTVNIAMIIWMCGKQVATIIKLKADDLQT